MLYELLYTSSANHDFSQHELVSLLLQAREHNQKAGITGLLVYYQREFMQLLEGEESEIRGLWKRIFFDSRHRSPQILHEGTISRRAFPNWSMAFPTDSNNIDTELSCSLSNYLVSPAPLKVLSSRNNIGYKLLRNLKDMHMQPRLN